MEQLTASLLWPLSTPQTSVTDIFDAHVVVVDAETGAVIAGTLSGWNCNASTSALQFDGSYDIERLPSGLDDIVHAEPLSGLAHFSNALNDLCQQGSGSPCATPAVNAGFNPQVRPEPH